MLKVTDLHSGYGKIEILKGIRLEVPTGEIVSLIGCNGAGKTTFLMTVSGIVPAARGSVFFEGKSVEQLPPEARVRLGIVQVPEGRRVFHRLTVAENLDLGAYTRARGTDVAKDRDELMALFPILRERRHALAGNLSGGEQQMLAMARALMARPKLLLLDEPSLGLAPKMVDVIFSLICKISKERGITILLVEQNAYKALEIADTAYVIESGKILLHGTGSELLANPQVKSAYLGE